MFRKILTSMSICLQGTLFERRARKSLFAPKQETWYYSLEQNEECPPYLMVAEEFKVKYDFMTKLHTRDGHLLSGRDASKRGRAKWCPEKYEQVYCCSNEPHSNDPSIAVYYNALGLGITREPQII